MQDTWQTFIREQRAIIKGNGGADFNISETPITSPLENFTCLAISGEERHAFLHGQFINDLNLIESPAAQISAWCNPKGQVITNFIVVNTGIAYLLIFKASLKEYVQKRLSMFVMRSDVTISDITESSPLVGLANTNNLAAINSDMPSTPGTIAAVDGLIVICHPDQSGRYIITGSIAALIENIPKLGNSLFSSSVWEELDILAGLPWISTTTQEHFLPQMLNLDALKGLSYQKGCYPGQEVIARLHYRSEVKKRLHLIKSEEPLSDGNSLYTENSDKKVGTIINSILDSEGKTSALAIIEIDKIEDKLFSDSVSEHEVSILELPYDIES